MVIVTPWLVGGLPPSTGRLWFGAKRWRGLSPKGTNRTRRRKKRKNVHFAVSEMERMTRLATRASGRGPGHRAAARSADASPAARHAAPSRSGPARRAAWECESALSAATVWVMASRRLRHACLFRELRSGDEYIVRAPLPLEAVARQQRGVNQWHRSKAAHRRVSSLCADHESACLAVSHWILA